MIKTEDKWDSLNLIFDKILCTLCA